MRLGADRKAPSKPKVRYVLHFGNNRDGAFEFLCHNQRHWSTNLKKVRQELEDSVYDYMHSTEPPNTREEVLDEMGKPTIYKLTVEEVS
jgi:hypothetical protein